MSLLLHIKDEVLSEILSSFDPKLKMRERITIIADLEMYRWKEDKSVYLQKKEQAPLFFTIHFDGVYMSTFISTDPIEKILLDFWKALKGAYKEGKVRLTPKTKLEEDLEELQEREEKNAQKKAIEALPEATPTEKQAKHVIKKLAEKEQK